MATTTYFTVVIRVTVQIIKDNDPMIKARFTVCKPPLFSIIDFSTYIGDVPISPYTTPMVTSSMAGVTTRFFNVFSPIRYTLSAS